MKTRTKSCGFAAFAFALVTLAGCGGGGGSSSTTTTTTTGPTNTNNQWTWVSGNNTVLSLGNYGTKGTAAATNQPPSRYGATYWTDSSGNFYVFGGIQNGTGAPNFLNDLWKYSPSANQWTWVSGSNAANQTGVYGTINVVAAANVPGARYAPVSWRDSSGNLYLLGGVGVDSNGVLSTGPVYMNDLWKYNISSGQWIWIGGSSSGANASVAPAPATYGTLGTAAAGNFPGVRANATGFTDSTGNFWLFGGQGGDVSGAFGNLNDLWKYSTSTNQWTWVSGSSNAGAGGTYGTLGTGSSSNTPGSRYNAAGWADSSGNLWLFGGSTGATTTTNSTFTPNNDLWKFSTSNAQWTWVAGSNTSGAAGSYGTKGTAAAGNTPGARAFPMVWTDSSNNLYLFGGAGVSTQTVLFNDLWKFSPSSGQWVWLNGTNGGTTSAGVYGTQGTSTSSTIPGGRLQGASWSDTSGNLWLFGGQGFDSAANVNALNDLWKYQP